VVEGSHKQATLHDVARLANVSHQTVSRVINESPNVADETRKRVQQAIEALNYRPNRAARSLITGHSQTIQVVDFAASYLPPIPIIVSEANKLDYRLGVSILRDNHTRKELRDLLDDLTSRLVDGFLLFSPREPLTVTELDALCRGVPYVQMGGTPIEGAAGVLLDHAVGMVLIMDHLLNIGHREIVEISGPLNMFDARLRHAAYEKRMIEAGLAPGPLLEGDFTSECGYQLACQLVQSRLKFTAIVCGNDDTALGVMRALHYYGLRIPEDVSVVGFDDHSPVRYYEPPLTTVRQDYSLMSQAGLQYLVKLIQEPETPREQRVIRPELVIRESTRSLF
jgi:DNA-binding LacI/PurR family transcriptional regulator